MSALAKVAVVTGANKGLGLAFAQKLASDGYRVFGACRGASKAAETPARFAKLLSVPGVELIECDVSDEASRTAAAAAILERTNHIDLLINNAGILKWESTLADVTEAALLEAFQVNCIGALMLIRALLPLIARSEQKQIVNISSGFASITDNSSSRCYSYRISKAALSMLTKCVALDEEKNGVQCIAVEPAWVATDMGLKGNDWTEGQPLPAGIITAETAAASVLAVADAKRVADVRASSNGKLFWLDGSEMPF